jgi:ribose 5-phosphate isomerase B
MKIAIGSDHAGFVYKEEIKKWLKNNGHTFHDFGTDSEDSVDYPLFIRPVAEAVSRKEYERGIILGGSGNGEAIVANRVHGIRCTLCWSLETARLARQHNDANMLSLGARLISLELALEIVKTWLEAPFEGGRHIPRIKQIDQEDGTDQSAKNSQAKHFKDARKTGSQDSELKKSDTQNYDLVISFRYMIYSEGKNALEFKIDPGLKSPSIIHIPSPDKWNSEVPEWAKNRREEILERIKTKSAHLECEWKEY